MSVVTWKPLEVDTKYLMNKYGTILKKKYNKTRSTPFVFHLEKIRNHLH